MKTWLYSILVSFFVILNITTSEAQIISTVAGSGVSGYSGDGGAATMAKLNYNNGLIKDASGNLFIADRFNNVIRKVDPSGVITTYAGTGAAGFFGDGGPASAAQFSNPIDVALDAAGNLYISDEFNNRVRMINTSGIITTVAGSSGSGYFGDGGPATSAQLNEPWGITVDAGGNIYIADEANARVRKVDAAGIMTTVAGNGTPGYSGDGVPATGTELNHPADVWADAAGNIYITEYSNSRVRKVDATGIISTYAGNGSAGFSSDGIPATASELNDPIGIVMDAAGNMYIGDGHNNRVRKINPAGIISTIAGTGTAGYSGDGGPALAATFNYVYNLAIDPSHNIYVGDASNNVVRMILGNNLSPYFTGGHSQSLSVCENSTANPINAQMTAADTSTGLTDNWTVYAGPVHGTVVATYATTSTGGTLVPVGLSYTPTAGYSGPDSFKVRVSNGLASDSTTVHVTVTPLPVAGSITGSLTVCAGSTTLLTDITPGGVWSSASPFIASVDPFGTVTGIASGSAVISYTVTNACGVAAATATVVVNAFAGVITGTPTVCVGAVTVLSDAVPGGAWSSVSPGIASVSGTGAVTGVSAGTTVISYTVTNSCGVSAATITVVVNPLPTAGTITGLTTVCVGNSTTLSDAAPGGTWSAVTPSVGTVDGAGNVTGVSTGTTIISYTVVDVCGTAVATKVVTVDPQPNAGVITGIDSVCPAHTVTLADTVGGGAWSSSNTAISTVSSSGVVTGVATGTDTIRYTVNVDGCLNSAFMTFYVRTHASCVAGVPVVVGGIEKLDVFPNPNDGWCIVRLTSPVNQSMHIVITNILGQKVGELEGTTNTDTQLKLNSPAGVYFVTSVTVGGNHVARISIQ